VTRPPRWARIAAGARHRQAGGERDGLLGELSQRPDLTLHALLASSPRTATMLLALPPLAVISLTIACTTASSTSTTATLESLLKPLYMAAKQA
jgi:hypothetical protein